MLVPFRSQPRFLSLTFEKYGRTMDLSLYPEEVAFLWFTNGSDTSYLLPMVGSTNSSQRDSPFTFDESLLVMYEFDDKASPDSQSLLGGFGSCHVVEPHSAIRIRVPLPLKCQRRKVSVICAEMSTNPRPFWRTGIGFGIYRMLPRSLGMKLLGAQPTVQHVWCNQELSRPDEKPGSD
jgi:hypothetical protein